MALTNEEKLLFVAIADEIIVNMFGTDEHFTDREREDIADRLREVFDENSPKSLRTALVNNARKFYEEVSAE